MKLTDEYKEFIREQHLGKTAEELSARLRCSVRLVKEFCAEENLRIMKPVLNLPKHKKKKYANYFSTLKFRSQ